MVRFLLLVIDVISLRFGPFLLENINFNIDFMVSSSSNYLSLVEFSFVLSLLLKD